MKLPARYWINQFSLLGFMGIIAYLPAGIVGEFFAIAARYHGPSGSEQRLAVMGSVFGFCMVALLLIGVIVIPGEQSGLIRSYKRSHMYYSEAREMSRTVLLISVSILSWVALVSIVLFAFSLQQ